ncbi:Alpha/Beta hydrolase protein [Mycena polygramma]|nr:Alpha/Beta hydrolase protein [Mycena polygramma]
MALHTLFPVALLWFLSVRAVESSLPAPVVDLGYAQYQGVVDTELNITAFRGIRYAAPPTGTLRWQAPHPPSTVGGVQQASNDPPQCYQGAPGGAAATNPLVVRDVEETEDCLFLSVYSPAVNSTASLPTIVWIHGGGFLAGQESIKILHCVGSLKTSIISDELSATQSITSADGTSSGDPKKVTIWGESAGAGSVLQHVVARNGKRILRSSERQLLAPPSCRRNIRTTTESLRYLPAVFVASGLTNYRQAVFNDVAAQAGCNGTEVLDCLRAVDTVTLVDINVNTILAGFQGTYTFVPVIDGSFITQSPTDALLHGKVNGDVLLSVTNTNEGFIFVNQTAEYDVAEYASNLFPLFGAKESNATASIYKSLGSSLDQVNAIMTESIFLCPIYLLLDAFSGKSYKDLINYFPSFTDFGLTLIFNNTDFINAFTQGFVSFAANLDPDDKLRPSIVPVWRKWSRAGETEMLFNETELGAPDIAPFNTSSALLERCE